MAASGFGVAGGEGTRRGEGGLQSEALGHVCSLRGHLISPVSLSQPQSRAPRAGPAWSYRKAPCRLAPSSVSPAPGVMESCLGSIMNAAIPHDHC